MAVSRELKVQNDRKILKLLYIYNNNIIHTTTTEGQGIHSSSPLKLSPS